MILPPSPHISADNQDYRHVILQVGKPFWSHPEVRAERDAALEAASRHAAAASRHAAEASRNAAEASRNAAEASRNAANASLY